MPQGMLLKSERFASNLWDPKRRYTLRRYCEAQRLAYQAVGSPLSLELFLEYAEWFRQQTAIEPRDLKVRQLRRAPGGFGVQLTDGTSFTSRRVILATGHMAFRVLPPELTHLPEPLVLHSTRIGDVRRYAGRDVCVIGAGQSALETAALLHENGARVRVLVRREHIEWNAPSKPRPLLARILEPDAGIASGWKSLAVSELPRVFRWCFPPEKRHRFVAGSYGPSGSWWLRERVEGRIAVLLSSRVLSAEAGERGVRLQVQGPERHRRDRYAARRRRDRLSRSTSTGSSTWSPRWPGASRGKPPAYRRSTPVSRRPFPDSSSWAWRAHRFSVRSCVSCMAPSTLRRCSSVDCETPPECGADAGTKLLYD